MGYGDHMGWYAPLAEVVTEKGLAVASQDLVGHGRSEGPRAFVRNCNEYVQDVIQHLTLLREQFPDIPIFVNGYSMGGWIAIKLALEKQEWLKGLVVVGPMVKPNPETATPFKVAAAKLIAKVWSTCPIASLDSTFMCRDKEVVKKYEADELCYHGKMKAGQGTAMLNAMAEIDPRLEELTLPMLIIHGGDDKVCLIQGSEELHSRAKSTDKKLSLYEGCYHAVFNEPEGQGEKCKQEIADWISSRL